MSCTLVCVDRIHRKTYTYTYFAFSSVKREMSKLQCTKDKFEHFVFNRRFIEENIQVIIIVLH